MTMQNDNENPDDGQDIVEYDPPAPEVTLDQIKESFPDEYPKLLDCILFFARNRHITLLKASGKSAGLEQIYESIEDDINFGYAKVANAVVDGKIRCCLYEFNKWTGKYDFSSDNNPA